MGLDRCFFILKLSINEVSKCKQSKVHLLPVTYSLSAELSFKTHFILSESPCQTNKKFAPCHLTEEEKWFLSVFMFHLVSAFSSQTVGGVVCVAEQ